MIKTSAIPCFKNDKMNEQRFFYKQFLCVIIIREFLKEGDEMLSEEMTKEIVSGLTNIFNEDIERIILYGSVARKEETLESDVDIAIIIKKQMNEAESKKFITWAADLDLKFNKVFSIIDIQEDVLKKWGDTLPFYKNIREEGIELWRAA